MEESFEETSDVAKKKAAPAPFVVISSPPAVSQQVTGEQGSRGTEEQGNRATWNREQGAGN